MTSQDPAQSDEEVDDPAALRRRTVLKTIGGATSGALALGSMAAPAAGQPECCATTTPVTNDGYFNSQVYEVDPRGRLAQITAVGETDSAGFGATPSNCNDATFYRDYDVSLSVSSAEEDLCTFDTALSDALFLPNSVESLSVGDVISIGEHPAGQDPCGVGFLAVTVAECEAAPEPTLEGPFLRFPQGMDCSDINQWTLQIQGNSPTNRGRTICEESCDEYQVTLKPPKGGPSHKTELCGDNLNNLSGQKFEIEGCAECPSNSNYAAVELREIRNRGV